MGSNKFFSVLALVLACFSAFAQVNPEVIYKKVVVGDPTVVAIKSSVPPVLSGVLPSSISMSPPVPTGNANEYAYTFTNVTGVQGDFDIPIRYIEMQQTPKIRYTTIQLKYVSNILKANNDFITSTYGSTISIDPTLNDYTENGSFSLGAINQVQTGSAQIINGQIQYTAPDQGATDIIVYTIKDQFGNHSTAKVTIKFDQEASNTSTTLSYVLLNTHTQEIHLPNGGFILDVAPLKGQAIEIHPGIYKYSPHIGATGLDQVTFKDALDNQVIANFKLIAKAVNRSSVRNDIVYTARNTLVIFDVLSNDLDQSYPVTSYSAGLTSVSNGVFSYTPPPGFVGEKNFSYTISYSLGETYTGKIKVVVGNQEPDGSLNHRFHTIKNKPIVLPYTTSIENVSFNVLTQPEFGAVNITSSVLEVDCDNVVGQNIITYTPYDTYYGLDEFDLQYCSSDSCYIYKIYVTVHDAEESDCICLGGDCVTPGDLNGDGLVSVSDLLTLGRHLGLSGGGQARADQVLPYNGGQYALDWAELLNNGRNAKLIDANGDGYSSVEDTLAISEHLGSFSKLVPKEVLSVKDFPFYLVPNATELDSGDVLIIDLIYGTTSKPALDVFGIAFSLNLPAHIVDSASVGGYFDTDGWFANGGSSLQMIKQPQDGKIKAAFTKTGFVVQDELDGFRPNGSSGSGKIGQISFVVQDELDGFKSSDGYITIPISLDQIVTENLEGNRFALEGSTVELKLRLNKDKQVATADKLLVFPNPAEDIVNLHFNGRNIIEAYEIIDAMGNIVRQVKSLGTQSTSISTVGLSNGVYYIQVISSEGSVTKKLQVLRD
jgi:hypothetical protein